MIATPATAHALMDSEHQTLMHWVGEAVRRLINAYPIDEAVYALDVVRQLARTHFETERVEMCSMEYPGWSAHIRDHARLIEELSRFRREIAESAGVAGGAGKAALRRQLEAWMLSHIYDYDKPYASWLRQRRSGLAAPGRQPHTRRSDPL
jgi:hemerythrin